ncbi:HEAT repeat domain-containing protein [Catellatospora sichuanensis]|uniref:HEAT repeat domain-containing protein n=1 Tax=Catellatospora sichuanensis TaxID=1969805 RepID=UPI0011825794|nr:HEAT repeat domain-containing protein [Catellatospora sichuanensis]
MTSAEWDLDDVLVVVGSSWGDYQVALVEWMARGPGPRHGCRPESARSRSTGEALPLTVIPLAYRNDRESRALIAVGRIESPWREVPWDIDNWGEPPCQVRGPRPFDRTVPNPERIDRIAASVLRILPPGPVHTETARAVLSQVPEFGSAARPIIRRLAAEARWKELGSIVQLAAVAALDDVAPVLCEVLESNARPPHPGDLVDALGQLRYDEAAELLEGLIGQFAYADGDLSDARRCIRALAAIDGQKSRARLTLISWRDWPGPIRQWAVWELEAKGQYIPPPGP